MSYRRAAVPAAFAVIYLVWGSTYLALSLALTSIAPFMLMGSRSLVGGCLLLAGAWLFGRCRMIDRRILARAGLCGVLLFAGCHGTLAYAQQRVPSGLTAVLLATTPFWIALISASLPGGERLRMTQLSLLGVGLVGVVLIVMGQGNGGAVGYTDIGLLLCAALSWALGTILSERWSPPDGEVAFAGIALLAGGIVLMIMSAIRGEVASFHASAVSGEAMAAWLYLTLAGTVLAFASYSWLLNQVPAALAATYTFVNPVIALLLGWAVLGEQLGMAMALGAALITASVVGLLVGRTKKASHKELSTTVTAAAGPGRCSLNNPTLSSQP
jgi:drug/metabolite transporter (DMT)-like permease